ncbi:MAG TPA: (Fe-S)-binding protein, partial [Polyangiaceae bacterium]|nr:(Fe-S)-binding protein [Polyangiaceae bacterium]
SYAAPAWACTGCYGCRELCDHRNDVTSTLYEARAAWSSHGVVPSAAAQTTARFHEHEARTREAVAHVARDLGARDGARLGLLVGCTYARKADRVAREATEVTQWLAKDDVALVDGCCGLPLLMAGDRAGFERAAGAMAERLRRFERVAVVDPGCAVAFKVHYPKIGVRVGGEVTVLVAWAAEEAARFVTLGSGAGRVRWHDPCQLGRGLGVYEAPRVVLTRILGEAPDEFDTRRERASCAGGGGLLPVTMPEQARIIASTRLAEHARNGGGRVVTGCASSLHALRRAGDAEVDDIVTWMARSARTARARQGPA